MQASKSLLKTYEDNEETAKPEAALKDSWIASQTRSEVALKIA